MLWNRIKRKRNQWITRVPGHGGRIGLIINGCAEGENYRIGMYATNTDGPRMKKKKKRKTSIDKKEYLVISRHRVHNVL